MNIKKSLVGALRRLHRNYSRNYKLSFSQCGEDLIINQLLCDLGIDKISYLDIGAHHPSYLSNTYLLYLQGGSGVCVEPDPLLYRQFLLQRPHDIHINCGIGSNAGIEKFYVMSTPTLNTFSEEEALRYSKLGNYTINEILDVRIETVNQLIKANFHKTPNFVSIDIEGWDLIILKSFDFGLYRPEVFCIETLSFTDDKTERKLEEIIEFMHSKGYLTYADTYINTIFVDSESWKLRP
jgi:FkbM family methyltransferase